MNREEKIALPDDVKDECIAILKGYERRKWSYKEEDLRRIRAVRTAREKIGEEFPEDLRAQICDGIIKSCLYGRKCPFEKLGLSFLSRSAFYRYRLYFLYEMAVFLGIA